MRPTTFFALTTAVASFGAVISYLWMQRRRTLDVGNLHPVTLDDEDEITVRIIPNPHGVKSIDGHISINDADADHLTELPHITGARATEIIELRPFSDLADLSKVRGIGPTRLNDILQDGRATL